jgi:hypothetical protein
MPDSKEITTAIYMFLASRISSMLSGRLNLETGSQKFKVAAAEQEVHASQHLYKITKIILFSGLGNLMKLSKGSMSERK